MCKYIFNANFKGSFLTSIQSAFEYNKKYNNKNIFLFLSIIQLT